MKHAGISENLPHFGNEIFEAALERIKVDFAKDEFLNTQEKAVIAQEEIECGIAEGRIDARKKGLAEGREKALIEIAVGLRNDGVPMEIIERRTGLTKEQIAAL